MRKVFNIILLAIIAAIVLLIVFYIVQRNTKINLPTPTGKYAVGRTTFEWRDTSRIDSLAMDSATHRELILWVWYPAEKNGASQMAEYVPKAWRQAIKKRQGPFSGFLNGKLSKIKTHSLEGVKLAASTTRYPVIIFKSGIGALTTEYTTIAEDLASHGYVVVGSDSPYSTSVVVFKDGRVITDNIKGNPANIASALDRDRRLNRLVTIWSDDNEFILDRLEQLNNEGASNLFYHHLDLNSVGTFGHAFGGATAFRFCIKDKRCKAGVDINGIPFGDVNINKLEKPFMFLMADTAGEQPSITRQIKANIDTIFNKLPDSRIWVSIKGTKAYNFSDQALLKQKYLAHKAGDLGDIDKFLGLNITTACIRTFFDQYLKDVKSTGIKDLALHYPEIKVVKR